MDVKLCMKNVADIKNMTDTSVESSRIDYFITLLFLVTIVNISKFLYMCQNT